MALFEKGTTVSHADYGLGTVKRTTQKPLRVWVTWDETGYTTCTNPNRLMIIPIRPSASGR